jgi:hypothetical protein
MRVEPETAHLKTKWNNLRAAVQANRWTEMLLINLRITTTIILPLVLLGMALSTILAVTPRPTPYEVGGYILLLAAVLAGFVFLSIVELWVIRKLGFDVLAHLTLKGKHGGIGFTLQTAGVIAFLIGQPIVLTYLLRELLVSVARFIGANP